MINEVKRAETGCPQDIMQKFLATAIGENDAWAIFQKVELNGKCHLVIGQAVFSCGFAFVFSIKSNNANWSVLHKFWLRELFGGKELQ